MHTLYLNPVPWIRHDLIDDITPSRLDAIKIFNFQTCRGDVEKATSAVERPLDARDYLQRLGSIEKLPKQCLQ